jgi:pimeloyl-ACP methyl ester carboxylesterase
VPTIDVSGVELYHEVYGEGPVILGIHGTPSSALLWQDPAQELARHGRCVIYDRRGFGRSALSGPLERLDLADHIADAIALLDSLSAGPAVVIGRSTGGQIALALAHRHPDRVRALALLEPAVFTVDAAAVAWAEALRSKVLRATAGDAAEVVFREALGDSVWTSFPDELREFFAAASPAVLADIRGDRLDLSTTPLALSDADLAGIGVPTLLVAGDDSPPVMRRVVDRLAETLPDAEQARVPGGHLVNPAHPVVLAFIDRVLTPGEGSADAAGRHR